MGIVGTDMMKQKIKVLLLNTKQITNNSNDLKSCTKKNKLDDEDKALDDEQLSFDKLEKRVNTVAGGSTGTVRNLRIREDIAKYLINLDTSSAYYDPKSRSMREDPHPKKPFQNKFYAGDNFLKTFGNEFQEFKNLQINNFHNSSKLSNLKCDKAISNTPSQIEALFKEYKNQEIKNQSEKSLNALLKYGNLAEKIP